MAKISTVDQKLKRKDPVKQLDQENFSILFFCEDQNIAHQIRGQNWESEKIHVTFAMDIEEATGLLYETPPTHIVLIDLHDSPICQTLYQEIYEHCKWLDIPIFYSVGEFQEMKQDYLYQFNDVLLYPFTKEEVLLRMQLEQERKNKVKSIENPLLGNGIYDFAFCSFFYQVHLAILARVKKPFTLLFVSVGDQEQPQGLQGTSPMPLYGKSIAERIVSQARDSDFVFKMNHQDLAIILLIPGKKKQDIS
ncbi:hypothetical protein [Caldalkalibacillus mannanilyticus]|uniref:hypothetical protein n=1 Tax=Caldalkalibacillus mannanilyticus TaxID=1418 RepID=UPI000467F5DA|nr:hypothetical protein [Caldalkalibacillus mannanilyticus]